MQQATPSQHGGPPLHTGNWPYFIPAVALCIELTLSSIQKASMKSRDLRERIKRKKEREKKKEREEREKS